jgi:hypothetical protein
MLILGNAGIILGAAALLDMAFSKRDSHVAKQYDMEDPAHGSAAVNMQSAPSASKASRLAPLAKQFDLGVLLIGSLLLYIVDKAVGLYLFRDIFNSGRIRCRWGLSWTVRWI